MFAKTLKTAALATLVIVATAGASMAATYAYVDHDAKVKKNHAIVSPTINQVWEGQQVKVIGQWNNWFKIQIPGKDGWVKAGALDFDYDYEDYGYGYGNGGSFCVNGQNAQFCLSAGY